MHAHFIMLCFTGTVKEQSFERKEKENIGPKKSAEKLKSTISRNNKISSKNNI